MTRMENQSFLIRAIRKIRGSIPSVLACGAGGMSSPRQMSDPAFRKSSPRLARAEKKNEYSIFRKCSHF